MTKWLLVAGLALAIAVFGEGNLKADPLCTPGEEPLKCGEAQLKAAALMLGEYKAEIARLEGEIAALHKPTVPHVISCHKLFTVYDPHQVEVDFTTSDCQGDHPKPNWIYSGSLQGTDICGGFTEYHITSEKIHFWGNFNCNTQSNVWVDWIGFETKGN
jgi:hypothetical protein